MRRLVDLRLSRSVLALLLCGPAGVFVYPQESSAAWYEVGYIYVSQGSTAIVEDSSSPGLVWLAATENTGSHVRARQANADFGMVRTVYNSYKSSDWTIGTDEHPWATMRYDDLIFTCSDGSGQVAISLNLYFEGNAILDPPGPAVAGAQRASVIVNCTFTPGSNLGTANLGTWVASSSDPGVPQGALGSVNADNVAGIFTTPTITVPTGVPVSLVVLIMTRLNNCCEPGVRVNGNGMVRFPFATESPVFNFHSVPGGVTCNASSTEANIVDNLWNAGPIPVEARTWGGIKRTFN